jgi:regulator of sigma E protease
MIVLNILVFIIVLGVIILIHEFGHFIVAKKCNILVYEFAFGMGPLLVGKKKGETLYSIRAVPLGGFCSMGGEDINEAMISKGQKVGLVLDDTNTVIEFVLTLDTITPSVEGVVVDYDLYGIDETSKLFITLEVGGENKEYNVARNAIYSEKKINRKHKKSIQIVPRDRSFEAKALWKRLLVVFAGPLMNFVLAFFVFLLLSIVDVTQYKPSEEPIVGSLTTFAGTSLKNGDRIIEINDVEVTKWDDIGSWKQSASTYESVSVRVLRDGEEITFTMPTTIAIYSIGIYNITQDNEIPTSPLGAVIGQNTEMSKDLASGDIITKATIGDNSLDIHSWNDLITFFKTNNKGGNVTLHVIRNLEELDIVVASYSEKLLVGQGLTLFNASIGISPEFHYNFGYMWKNASVQFGKNAIIIFTTLGQLFTGDVKITQLSGPVGIFKVVGSAMSNGVLSVLFLIGLLSVNVGIMNLLPIPALDGGRIVFLIYELITRRKVNKKVESTINNVAYILLLLFMAAIVVLDVIKLF